jgi:hypothetical protein
LVVSPSLEPFSGHEYGSNGIDPALWNNDFRVIFACDLGFPLLLFSS